MNERKRLFLLILLMSVVSLLVASLTITVLYQTAFEEERERLVETARSQARLIEAVARFDADREKQVPGVHPEGSVAATLSQIEDAHRHYRGFGKTGEFTLARREGDQIIFLLRHRHDNLEHHEPVPFDSDLAEPMRRALSGKSGTVVGRDYRGVTVLAAHEPVAELDLGIVAKIDLEEIREPFVKAALIALGAGLVVVLVGAGLFLRVSEPLVKRLEERANELTAANEQLTQEIEERGRAESELQWELSVNSALSELYEPLLSPFASLGSIANTVFSQAKRLTGSEHGYVSAIDPVTGDNVGHTLTEMLQGQCEISGGDRRIVFPCGPDGRYPGLWGYALNERESFYVNSPQSHPASQGVPRGHVPVERFLSVPVVLGEELVGQIALANPDEDYTEQHLEAVRRLAEFYALAIQRQRTELDLRKAHEQLERRVEERTAALSKINAFLKEEVRERKRAVEENKRQSEFLRNVLESITHPFYVIDVDGYKVKMANSASNVDPDSMDAPCYVLLHKQDSPCNGAPNSCPVDVVKRTKQPVVVEHAHYDAEGNSRNTEVHGYPIFDENGNVSQIIEYNLDITARKRIEKQIMASLKEKEVLLREIHHRVKNNLQTVASLLDLQADKIEDKKALEVFKESRNRIRSMALIHEKMYQSKDIAQIDFAQYITDLVSGLYASVGASENVSLMVDIGGALPDIDMAICCGLIVNELVSNSLKYAFPEGRSGEILVAFSVDNDGSAVLAVGDDGVGFPEDLDFKKTVTLGLQLVNTLSEQLDGDIRLVRDGGTRFEITFDTA